MHSRPTKKPELLSKRSGVSYRGMIEPVLVSLNVAQLNWHQRWSAHGGSSIIIVGVGSTLNYFAIEGSKADAVNKANFLEMHALALVCGFGDEFWNSLKAKL